MNTLVWFQRDLRLAENPALNWALQRGRPVAAVFVHSSEEDEPWQTGPASSWWLHHSLLKLSADLQQRGIKLHFFKAHSKQKIPELLSTFQADAITWTNRPEPQRVLCETEIDTTLNKKGFLVKRFQDELLLDGNDFLTKTRNTPYRVFTPFYKRLRQQLNHSSFHHSDTETLWPPGAPVLSDIDTSQVNALNLNQLGLLGKHPWHTKLSRHWQPGEEGALKKLDFFIAHNLEQYSQHRDFPRINGTSGLSPHLHFGEISPQQIFTALEPFITFYDSKRSDNSEGFLRQLIWREFARYTLRHFPDTANQPMNKKFTQSFWQFDNAKLEQWQRGTTGVPIIDAGMRQLWETGWMHNRVRMLAASFLTKNLGIPWLEGARWFWHTLVDADLANNSMGWQWVAGCGVDAAPYFRIFNPLTQTQRFDRNHAYINRWNKTPVKNTATSAIVDVAQSRKEALLRYKRLMKGQAATKSD